MYRYDPYDQRIVDERVAQFRDQTRRYLAGELTDEEFRPLRLQNGLYIQRHAPMLRVAVPSGLLKIVMYDDRPDSATRGVLCELALGRPEHYGLLRIPVNVWYGFTAMGDAPENARGDARMQVGGIASRPVGNEMHAAGNRLQILHAGDGEIFGKQGFKPARTTGKEFFQGEILESV